MGAFEILDTDEPLAQRIERHAYDRLIMLSDGVFAIAITLSAIEIRPPPGWDQNPATLPRLMGPALGSYAIAFIVISAYWMAHRRMIALFRRVDGPASVLTLVFLALVALQPAAIRLLVQYRIDGGAGHVYFGQILLLGLVQAVLWLYAWFVGRLIDPALRAPARWLMLVNIVISPLLGALLGANIGRVGAPLALGIVALIMGVGAVRRRLLRRFGL